MKKSGKILLAFIVVAIIIVSVVVVRSTTPLYKQVKSSLQRAETEQDYLNIKNKMIDGGKIKKEAPEALAKAWTELDNDADRMKLAYIAVHLQEAGLAQAEVQRYVDDILDTLSYKHIYHNLIYDERDFDLFDTLLAAASDKEMALNHCLDDLNSDKKMASLILSLSSDKEIKSGIDQLLEYDESTEQWETLSPHFGLAFRNESLESQLRAISIIGGAGMNASAFSERVYEGLAVQDAISTLTGLNDNILRKRAASAFASGFKDNDDILSYLYQCKKIGIQPSECYPSGVEFNLGIAQFETTVEYQDSRWLDDTKLLIIRHYEIAEPLEQKKIGESQDEEQIEYTEGFSEEYDGIDKSLIDNYECRLDTNLLDMVPIEHFPDKLENCTAFISLEGMNLRAGSIQYTSRTRTTRYTTYGSSRFISDINDSPVFSIYEIPTYAYVQMVCLRSYPKAENLYIMDRNVVMPDDIPENYSMTEEANKYGLDKPNDEFRIFTQASPDESWDTARAKQMLSEIDNKNWNIMQYVVDILANQ